MAIHFFNADGRYLKGCIDKAKLRGVKQLVLSSENFVRLYSSDQNKLEPILQNGNLHLLFTLNSVLGRVSSTWQEQVKHGHEGSFSDSIIRIKKSPGLQPNLIENLISKLQPMKTSVIFSSRTDHPNQLIANFLLALSTKLPAGLKYNLIKRKKENVSLDLIESEVLRNFNAILKSNEIVLGTEKYQILRNSFLSLFRSKLWRDNCPHIRLNLPDQHYGHFKEIAERTLKELRRLKPLYNIKFFGNPLLLLEDQ